jgi:heme-degrading monooxygenase HmoA
MVTVGMYYDVIAGKDALFRAKFQEVLAQLEAIPGHQRSFLYQRVDDPGSYAILSEWESREAFLDFIPGTAFRLGKTVEPEGMRRGGDSDGGPRQ